MTSEKKEKEKKENTDFKKNFPIAGKFLKIEEQAEEQGKQSKDSNIIIHGADEGVNDDDDHKFVYDLMRDINIPVNTNTEACHVSRIGQKSKRARPLKVVFKDGHVKYRFMQRLKDLKKHQKILKH